MKKARFIALLIAVCLLVAACSNGDAPGENTGPAPDSGSTSGENEGGSGGVKDVITVAVAADATTMDPQGSNENHSGRIREHIFETLIYQDENQELVPGLAPRRPTGRAAWSTPRRSAWAAAAMS